MLPRLILPLIFGVLWASSSMAQDSAVVQQPDPFGSRSGTVPFDVPAPSPFPTEPLLLSQAEDNDVETEDLPTGEVPPGQLPAPPPGGIDVEDFDSRLKELEESWTSFQEKQDADRIKSALKPTFRINGRIHADFWGFLDEDPAIGFFENDDPDEADFGSDPEDAFLFRRIRLEMRGEILETMYWRMQLDFNNPSSGEMKDVFIGFKELPYNHRLQIGNQKRPLGLDHLNSSRYNVFLERPFVIEAFNEDARRPGITLYGNTDDLSLGWAAGAYLLENIARDGRYRGEDMQASGNARIFGSPWYDESSGGRGYYHWAIAGMVASPDGDLGPDATNNNEGRFRTRPEARSVARWLNTGRIDGAEWYEIAAVESMLNLGPLQIVGEYQHSFVQRDGMSGGPDVTFHGGYVYVCYNLTGEHIPYNRSAGTIGRLVPFENFWLVNTADGDISTGWGAWQLAVRYSWLDLTDADVTGGVGHAGTLALNWFFTPYSKLQFNLIHGNIDERGPIGGFSEGDYWIAGARFAIEF